ncbi:MAG TPA: endonuclease MutS2, partial [Bacteroidales bacterium]|nr:endonuclease MutS2 [Bacteroidales bacterium]
MIYPENFESKIGFDRIRSLLSEKCLSPMGLEKVENIRFIDDYDKLSHELTATYEFQQILQFEDFFPAEHYYRISDSLGKIRVEGTFPEVQEVFDLKRSLETVKTILNFFRNKDSVKYPVLRSICSSVKTYPYVLEAIDRIIDKRGVIRDNASSRLKEIRAELIGKSIQVSKRLNAILKQAQSEGIVDTDTSVSVRNGRGVIP